MSNEDEDNPSTWTKEDLYNGPGPESLPEELQKARKDDTTCKVCGVSYLVFSEIKSLQRRTEEAENTMLEWKEKIDSYSSLEKKYNELLQDLKKKDARLDDLQEKLHAAETRADNEANEIEKRWKNRLARELQEEKSKLEERMKAQAEEHTKAIDAFKQEREQALWEARKQIKEQQQATVRKHGVQLLSGVRALKPSFNQLKKDLEGMAGEVTKCVRQGVSHLTQIRDKTESELDRVTEKVLAARRAKEKAEAALGDLRRSEQCFKQECANLKEEKKRLQDEISTMKSQSSSELKALQDNQRKSEKALKQQLAAKEQEFAEERRVYAERVDAAESSQRKLQAKLEEVMVSRLNATLETIMAAAWSHWQSDLETLREKKRQSDEKYQGDLARTKEDLETQLKSLRSQWNAQEKQLQNQLQQYSNDKEQAEDQAEEYRKACEEYKELMDSVQQDLQAHIASEEAWRQRAEQAIAENQQVQETLNELTKRAKAAEAAHARAEKVIAETRDALDKEKARADHAVKEAEETIKAASSTEGLEGLEKHLIQLSQILRQKETEIRHLESTVHQECMERTVILDQLNAMRASASLPPVHLEDIRKAAHDPGYGEHLASIAASQMAALQGAGGSGSNGYQTSAKPPVPVPGAGSIPRAAGTGSAAIRALRPMSGSSSGSGGSQQSGKKGGPAWAPPSAVRGGGGRGRGRGKWK